MYQPMFSLETQNGLVKKNKDIKVRKAWVEMPWLPLSYDLHNQEVTYLRMPPQHPSLESALTIVSSTSSSPGRRGAELWGRR